MLLSPTVAIDRIGWAVAKYVADSPDPEGCDQDDKQTLDDDGPRLGADRLKHGCGLPLLWAGQVDRARCRCDRRSTDDRDAPDGAATLRLPAAETKGEANGESDKARRRQLEDERVARRRRRFGRRAGGTGEGGEPAAERCAANC